MRTFGILAGIALVIYAIFRDPVTQCTNCRTLYTPSHSDAKNPLLFGSRQCEVEYRGR